MMVIFLPWCPLDKEYAGKGIRLLPYSAIALNEKVESLERETIDKILAIYRDLQGEESKQAALIQYKDRPFTADLDEAELNEVWEFVELACFSALAKRELFKAYGSYCNRDNFTCYAHRFNETPPKGVTFETPHCRGVGSHLSFYSLDKPLMISVPEHVVLPLNKKITLDDVLLRALLDLQARLNNSNSPKEWDQWLAALECFNWANTDRTLLPYAVEWVLMCGAFEKILDASPSAENVAEKFTEILQPLSEILASNSNRSSDKFVKEKNLPLRQEWMREFYRLRGNLAHGWLKPRQPSTAWTESEHLTLARLVFPLLVKALLEKEKLYRLTQEDKTWISAFEELADTRFLECSKEAEDGNDGIIERVRRKYFQKVIEKEVLMLMGKLSPGGEGQND